MINMQTIIKQELINDFIKIGLEKGDVVIVHTSSTLFVDGEDFEDIGLEFEKNSNVNIGKIGEAESRLMSQVELVDYSISWIEQNRR